MTKTIELSRGMVTIVDDEDYERFASMRWYANSHGYAKSGYGKGLISMHRVIANAKRGEDVDHINGNPLDNRRENLRVCTRRQNCANVPLRADNTTGFKGVTPSVYGNRFRAQINVAKRRTHLGTFDTAEEAARAYDRAAREQFGEFAWVNFK